jgi:uncharacterized membrane protein
MRSWLLIFHILGAAGWIGGGLFSWFASNLLARNASSTGTAARLIAGSADRYFGPVAVVTLLTGIALVWTQDAWGWTDTFVLVGIGVFVFSAVWEPLVASKAEERLLAAIESGDGAGPALGAANRVALVDVGVLLVALWAMVVKLGA